MCCFLYIVQCRDDSFYTGITADLDTRIGLHNSGKGARYTRGRGPVKLVYSESFATRGEALRREKEIKRWPRKRKLAIIQNMNSEPVSGENQKKEMHRQVN